MCGDCWNAGMALPATAVAARFAWVGYRERIPFLRPKGSRPGAEPVGAEPVGAEPDGGVDEPVGDGDDELVGVGVGSS